MYADPKYRELSIEAVTLLNEGRMADAIKSLRQSEGLGLREARARVNAYLSREPMLRAQLELRQRAARRRFFLWFLLVDLVIAAAVIYWMRYRNGA